MMQTVSWVARTAFLTLLLLGLPQWGYAGREPEIWDTLPQITGTVFSNTSIGFMSSDERYFVLDRASQSFRQVDAALFPQYFPDMSKTMPSETIRESGIGSIVVLRASDGRELKTQNAYCSEGEKIKHRLWIGDTLTKDHVRPCHSVSAIEIVQNLLWLGTRHDGEYGDYPAQGIVIQSLDRAQLITKISSKQGLTGDLIRAIRWDGYTNTIWVTTERGFNQIDGQHKVITARYFYEDLDAATGAPVILLNSVMRPSNPFAVIARLLAIQNTKAFYQSVQRIPLPIRQQFSLYNFHAGIYSSVNARSVEGSFEPQEANVLVPFFIEAAQSAQEQVQITALSMLCMFNDERAFGFFKTLEQRTPKKGSEFMEARYARDCLDKYGKLGLTAGSEASDRIKFLIDRERAALEEVRSASLDRPLSLDKAELVVEAAKSLKGMGRPEGIRLINEYFLTAVGNGHDARLYDYVLRYFSYDDSMTPTALEGLKKIRQGEVYRGCDFFDMTYERLLGNRYAAKHAEAMLIALERVMNPSEEMKRSGLMEFAAETCMKALGSQLRNSEVRSEFLKQIYPTLSKTQKSIADRLLP